MAASQQAGASLREGFAFRSGRLTASSSRPIHRQQPAWVCALREGSNANFEALNNAFLCAKHSRGKTSKRERTLQAI